MATVVNIIIPARGYLRKINELDSNLISNYHSFISIQRGVADTAKPSVRDMVPGFVGNY